MFKQFFYITNARYKFHFAIRAPNLPSNRYYRAPEPRIWEKVMLITRSSLDKFSLEPKFNWDCSSCTTIWGLRIDWPESDFSRDFEKPAHYNFFPKIQCQQTTFTLNYKDSHILHVPNFKITLLTSVFVLKFDLP